MKIRNLLLFVCIAGCFAACEKNDSKADKFDDVAQYKIDTAAINKFVKDNKIVGVQQKSGIFYQIIEPGTGTVSYNGHTQITVDYKGSLLNGTVFDDSKGTPVKFYLGNVIGGWQLGIPLIQKGGKIRLLLPSFYGYRNIANERIPANSVLDFTVNLIDVQVLP